MLSHWTIKLLHVVFVFSLGTVTLWLFFRSLASDRVRRSSPLKRAEFFLTICRNGAPYLRMPLKKSHYLIGRGPECDIPLKGVGIPVIAGEVCVYDGDYIFRNYRNSSVPINGGPISETPRKLLPGDEIMLYNYTIQVKGKDDESVRPDRHRETEGKE